MLTDGWCLPILLNEALAIYEGLLAERHVTLDKRRPFRDYILWLARQDRAAAASFGATISTDLPARRPWGSIGCQVLPMDCGVSSAARSICPRERRSRCNCSHNRARLTLSVLVQGAWSVLLSRYSGATDVVFGATVSGRPPEIANVDAMIGLFINTLPVRVKIVDHQSVVDFLTRLQNEQVARDAFAHTPLVQIQSWSQVAAPTRSSKAWWSLKTTPWTSRSARLAAHSRSANSNSSKQTNLPITLMTAPAESLPLKISYDGSRFDHESIGRMLAHLGHLLESLAADPERTVADWPMMPERERQQLLIDWNDTRSSAAIGDKTLALFIGNAGRKDADTRRRDLR